MGALAAILAGWLIADFLSGLIHWVEDRFVDETTPVIGAAIGAPNDLHHRLPDAFLAKGLIERNWTTWAAIVPITATWLFLLGPSLVLLGAVAGGLMSNEVHAWAHRRDLPPVVRAMQRCGAFQSRPGHARHHRGAMRSDYCVLTDWLNPWLELLGLWRALDRLLARWQK